MPVKELAAHFQFAAWRVPQFPRAIEYPLEVMEEIRAFACDELLQLSHGGDEVGGVLFGTRREDLIRILTWRPMACEHSNGEGLRLSYNDRMNLAVQLEVARQNPDLKDLRPLGWFVSHLSGDVSLLPSDLEIYNGFFPETWQVTLVICPRGSGRAQAGFFVREGDGKLQTESSHQCFELERVQPPEPLRAAAAAIENVSSTPPASSEPPMAPPLPPPPVMKLEQPEPIRTPEMRPENLPTLPAVPLPPLPVAPVPPPMPSVQIPSFQMDDEAPRRERWLWAIPILLAVGIAAFLLYQRHFGSPNTSVGLRAWSEGHSVQLAWNVDSRAIRDSYRGEMEINDGSKDSQVSLTVDQLHAGKLTYLPQSGDVTFAMSVYTTHGDSMRDSTRVIAPGFNTSASVEPPSSLPTSPPALIGQIPASASTAPMAVPSTTSAQSAPSAPPGPEQDALEQQVQQLKAELGKERARANELQNLVRILENRLGIQSSAPATERRP